MVMVLQVVARDEVEKSIQNLLVPQKGDAHQKSITRSQKSNFLNASCVASCVSHHTRAYG